MKKSILMFFILITASIFSQNLKDYLYKTEKSSFLKNTSLQKVNYPGDSEIDAVYYKLDLNIDYDSKSIQGGVTVVVKSLKDGLNSFFLDLNKIMTVDSVFSNNQKITFSHTNDNRLILNLTSSYNSGQKVTVVVYYHGSPSASGFGSFAFNKHNGQPVVWSLSEPYGAKDWWPCKDTPGDKADSSDVWITSSNFFTVASNGNLKEVKDNGNNTKTWKWHNSYPIAQYLISFAMTNYTEYKEYFHYSKNDSMLVVHYIYPENFNDNTKEQVHKTIEMLRIYSELFGPYPWPDEKYGHAQFGWSGGMEHQTIASVGGFGEELIAHELAHQWYGDKITCKDWQDIWLNEGFATYAVALYYEKLYGKDTYNIYMNNQFWQSKYATGSIFVQNINSVDEIFSSLRSYSKGSAVLHMLRGIVGDSAFIKIMRTYAADPAVSYGVAVTSDFQRVAENIYGKSLDYFFNEWIYGENFPNYNVKWNYSDKGNDVYNINLNISQKENTNPAFFIMPIQIKINTAKGDTTFVIFNNEQVQSFSFDIKGKPDSLMFDPDNWILKNYSHTTGTEISLAPTSFKLNQNYPNPFNPTTVISYQLADKSKVILQVFDILGNEIVKLVNEEKPAGTYESEFNPALYGLASGVYLYQLRVSVSSGKAGGYIQTKKMVFLQ